MSIVSYLRRRIRTVFALGVLGILLVFALPGFVEWVESNQRVETASAVINSVGLALIFAGVLILYFNSPLNTAVLDSGDAFTDVEADIRLEDRRNDNMRLAVGLILLGTALQFLGQWL